MFTGELAQERDGSLGRRVKDVVEVQGLVGAVALCRFVMVDPCSAVGRVKARIGKSDERFGAVCREIYSRRAYVRVCVCVGRHAHLVKEETCE